MKRLIVLALFGAIIGTGSAFLRALRKRKQNGKSGLIPPTLNAEMVDSPTTLIDSPPEPSTNDKADTRSSSEVIQDIKTAVKGIDDSFRTLRDAIDTPNKPDTPQETVLDNAPITYEAPLETENAIQRLSKRKVRQVKEVRKTQTTRDIKPAAKPATPAVISEDSIIQTSDKAFQAMSELMELVENIIDDEIVKEKIRWARPSIQRNRREKVSIEETFAICRETFSAIETAFTDEKSKAYNDEIQNVINAINNAIQVVDEAFQTHSNENDATSRKAILNAIESATKVIKKAIVQIKKIIKKYGYFSRKLDVDMSGLPSASPSADTRNLPQPQSRLSDTVSRKITRERTEALIHDTFRKSRINYHIEINEAALDCIGALIGEIETEIEIAKGEAKDNASISAHLNSINKSQVALCNDASSPAKAAISDIAKASKAAIKSPSSNANNARVEAIAQVCMQAILDKRIESTADTIVSTYQNADKVQVRKACVNTIIQQVTEIAKREITAEIKSVARTASNAK